MSVLGKRARDTNHNNDDNEGLDDIPSKKQRLDDTSFPNVKANETIVLDVGGIKYKTTIQTLTGYTSMLKARFSSKYAMKPSADGSYFIDRNGKLFHYILEYFRNGLLLLPIDWNKQDIYAFYLEIKYYAIESLFQHVLIKLFDSIVLTNEALKMKVFAKMSEKGLNCDVKETIKHLYEWKLLYQYEECKFDNAQSQFFRNKIRLQEPTFARNYKLLLLIEASNELYGGFIIKENNAVNAEKSFVFRAKDNVSVTFDDARSLTNGELSKFEQEHQKVLLYNFHPLVICYIIDGYQDCGDFTFTYDKSMSNVKDVVVSKIELWKIV